MLILISLLLSAVDSTFVLDVCFARSFCACLSFDVFSLDNLFALTSTFSTLRLDRPPRLFQDEALPQSSNCLVPLQLLTKLPVFPHSQNVAVFYPSIQS